MSDSSTEINIPQPLNRPKEQSKVRANHPSKVTTEEKVPLTQRLSNVSRFEPAAISVEVPSHGFLYAGATNDADAARGIIKVRQLTLNEEKILTTDRFVQQGKALDMILENCIKSDIDPYSLISSDRLYLLFYIKGMSYGLDYDFDVKCYHCGFNFEQTIQIDKLEIKEWTEETYPREPIVIELPMSKFIIEAHMMRGREETKLMEKARELRNLNQADDSIGEALSLLADKVTTNDGEVLSPKDKEDFIGNMVAGDADFFRETIRNKDCGIQPLKQIYCPRCEGALEFNVPLGRNFFRRPEQRKKPTKI
jgi:hypothetical protein